MWLLGLGVGWEVNSPGGWANAGGLQGGSHELIGRHCKLVLRPNVRAMFVPVEAVCIVRAGNCPGPPCGLGRGFYSLGSVLQVGMLPPGRSPPAGVIIFAIIL